MATTVRDIIQRAYRKIGVVADDEPMTPDQAANGLSSLNAMMHGWKLFGIDIEHADLAVSQDFPLAPEFHEGAVYCLAQRIAPDNSLGFDGDMFLRALQAAFLVIPEARMPSALVCAPSSRDRWWR